MSKPLLFSLYKKVEEKGIIDEEIIQFIEEIYPNKVENILEVIRRGIKKVTYHPSNRIIWTAMGSNSEHLIYPKIYCSCQDFYKRVVIERNRDYCKHIIAQIICEGLKIFKEESSQDKKLKSFFKSLSLKE